MTSASIIMSRLRAKGANVELVDDALRLVNRHRVPPEAGEYIAKHRVEIADFLREEAEAIDERAAIIEFEGHTPREWAEQAARILIQTPSAGIDRYALPWFRDRVGQMLDAAPRVSV